MSERNHRCRVLAASAFRSRGMPAAAFEEPCA